MTSNELAPLNESDILPAGEGFAATGASSTAVAQLMQHAQAMGAAKQLADAMCATDMVPARYKGKPGDGAAAILYGAELGLTPIQSMQQIFTVHGSPAIYARTMVAILKSRGYRIWTVESTDESVTVAGDDPRTGQSESSTWTIERARKAQYTSNKKYDTDPQAMLYAKAASEVCKKLAPEVLLGMAHSVEDLELERVQATVEQVRPPKRGVAGLKAALAPAPAPAPDHEPEEPEEQKASREQQQRIAELLDTSGVKTKAAKLEYLQAQFGNHIRSAADIDADQAAALIQFLEQPEDPSVGGDQ